MHSSENDSFNFFKDLTEDEQNIFLEEYLTNTTKYLTRFQFPNSPNCFYFLPEFTDDKTHGNSISNLAYLLVLLMERDYLFPFTFNNSSEINYRLGTPVVYYYFTNWPIGNLHDKDFYSFDLVQDEQLLEYANILAN